jgi:hypothetical protein
MITDPTGNTILTFSDHDKHLVVWGVVNDQGDVRAYSDEQAATRAADSVGAILVGYDTSGGPRRTYCSRLVYYHTDLGWVFAAIGYPLGGIDLLPADTS